MTVKKYSRRDFLRVSGIGAAALLGGGTLVNFLSACTTQEIVSPTATSAISGAAPDVEIALHANPSKISILPGEPTRVWQYQAELLKGPPGTLQNLPNTYLGPAIKLNTGQQVRVHFTNQLSEPSIVHWHGLHVPQEADGHPRFAIGNGETYVYDFQVANRAGTYWYHPHPHGRTGPQAYYGMAGLFLVSDDEERALGLPAGEFDVPLVIQDRTFDRDNQLIYMGSGMMTQMMGFLGDRILVNGQPDFTLPVATRPYRIRLLNGSNSRIYKLAWEDGTPLTVIGTDGGLLEKPLQKKYITLAPSERAEIWVDFSQHPIGSEIRLMSLAFIGNDGGMMGGASLPQGAPFTVMTVKVAEKANSSTRLPEKLSSFSRYMAADAVNASSPRTFTLAMTMGMGWAINGRTFEMTDVADDEIVKLDTLEMWEFINQAGAGTQGRGMQGMMGGGMTLPHPMHVHGLQFQVVKRGIDPAFRGAWETVSDGYLDEGWKDTTLTMPGERVKILLKFEDFTGLYLYHCHNLEHEDMGMMRNYRVVA
ncbi:MAG: multicopper oxidase domain-containing protein [Chloroflexota bacterium]|nr:multicopper oxidase domain-containing protein [Chloroflexota bacterium]